MISFQNTEVNMFTPSSLHEKGPNMKFSGLYFLIFGLNMTKYGPEKTPYWDTFHALHVKSSRCDYAN